MAHSLSGWTSLAGAALLWLGLTAPARAALERAEFSLRVGQVSVPYLRVDRESGRWDLQSIGLKATRANARGQRFRLEVWVDERRVRTLKARAPSTFRFEARRGVPAFEIRVDRVVERMIRGRLFVEGVPGDPETREVCLGVRRAEVREMRTPGLALPEVLHGSSPRYTDRAIQAKVQGIVLLEFVVCPSGRASPDGLRVVRGLGHGLERAAIEAVLDDWRFRPGILDGRPVPVKVYFEVSFSLR